MNKEEQLRFLLEEGLLAIVRIKDPNVQVRVAEAVEAGGVHVIEFTMAKPNALDVIKEFSPQVGDRILLGAGTVLDVETGRAALLAGAQFLVAPNFDPELVRLARRYSKLVITGAFTPTEIVSGWECGADLVKVFPATALGPQYLKDVLAPLPHVRLLPTGRVNFENVEQFIHAGASAVAVGGNLVESRLVQKEDWADLTENARYFAQAVRRARIKKGTSQASKLTFAYVFFGAANGDFMGERLRSTGPRAESGAIGTCGQAGMGGWTRSARGL